MPNSRGNAHAARLQALRNRHAETEARLDEELKHPAASDHVIKSLKREKLRLKQAMEFESQDQQARA